MLTLLVLLILILLAVEFIIVLSKKAKKAYKIGGGAMTLAEFIEKRFAVDDMIKKVVIERIQDCEIPNTYEIVSSINCNPTELVLRSLTSESKSAAGLLGNFPELRYLEINNLDLSNCEDISKIFGNNPVLTYIVLNNCNVAGADDYDNDLIKGSENIRLIAHADSNISNILKEETNNIKPLKNGETASDLITFDINSLLQKSNNGGKLKLDTLFIPSCVQGGINPVSNVNDVEINNLICNSEVNLIEVLRAMNPRRIKITSLSAVELPEKTFADFNNLQHIELNNALILRNEVFNAGSLFENNENLTTVILNFKKPIALTNNIFKKCKKLSDIDFAYTTIAGECAFSYGFFQSCRDPNDIQLKYGDFAKQGVIPKRIIPNVNLKCTTETLQALNNKGAVFLSSDLQMPDLKFGSRVMVTVEFKVITNQEVKNILLKNYTDFINNSSKFSESEKIVKIKNFEFLLYPITRFTSMFVLLPDDVEAVKQQKIGRMQKLPEGLPEKLATFLSKNLHYENENYIGVFAEFIELLNGYPQCFEIPGFNAFTERFYEDKFIFYIPVIKSVKTLK